MSLFTFQKKERLVSKKEIDQLFREGKAFYASPLRIVYQKLETTDVRILISVPKRKYRKSVVRNRIKRLIREAYRLHRNQIQTESKGLNVAFIYTGDYEDIVFHKIEKSVVSALQKLDLC